jgi:superfamily I DNA and/or RNA helicase
MKKRDITGFPKSAVLTIDQCQGQEADVVVFSLVQKPTSFLNKNRLNVAMSRTKKKLIIVADRHEFRKASQNGNWGCSLIAKDILEETLVGILY